MTKEEFEALKQEADILSCSEIFDVYFERLANAVEKATKEKAAKVCDEEAMRCEKATQECEPDEVSALRSTAWKLSVCAAAIRSMK